MWHKRWQSIFLVLIVVSACKADYTLEIIAVRYNNPSNRDYNGDCCDVGFFSCNKCDVDFKFCVRAKGTSATSTSCWYSSKTKDDKPNSSSIYFPSSGELYGGAGLSNPIKFSRSGSWPGSFQLMVTITDSDGSTSDDLVDRVTFDMTLSPSNSWTDSIWGIRRYLRASFSARFRVRCNSYYYTSSCSVYCKPRDDSGGHYDCSSTGQKVCKTGWSDTSSNCLTPVCTSGCSQEGGYCNSPSECICKNGWTGALCDQCIPLSGCSADHGHCDGPYTCVCESGYGGSLCTQDADVCLHQGPCTHGATCTNTGLDSYLCTCVAGYTGTNCEEDINECATSPCENGATCNNQLNKYTCDCLPGYTGSNCEININECEDNNCENGATCNDLVNGYSCSCAIGYVGTYCQGHKCDSGPCMNNGTCVNITSGSGYKCDCVPGFEGTHCAQDVNECDFVECDNGGTCVNTHGSYHCVCSPGYEGFNCSIDTNDCATDNCSVHSLCVDGVNEYRCVCDLGYTGKLCDQLINYCDNETCLNGGTCTSYVGSFGCNCPNGFNGSVCEVNVDDCNPDPCSNGSVGCQDEVNGFVCICATGYTGTTCNTIIDHCDPNPCALGEDCIVDISNSSHSCVICIEDVCVDPAAVFGPGGNESDLHSPYPTSEAAEEQVGPIIGMVVAAVVLLCCCFFCLVCVCCMFKKRNKNKVISQAPFEGSAEITENPMFISPDLLASSNSFIGRFSINRKKRGLTSSVENPYDEVPTRLSKQMGLKRGNSPRPNSPRPNSPRPTSPSKKGYVSLNDHEIEEDMTKEGNCEFQIYNKVEEAAFDLHYASYSSTNNPSHATGPSVKEPLPPPLPPRDSSINPYEPLPPNTFNPYETIPSLENDDNLYQEIKEN